MPSQLKIEFNESMVDIYRRAKSEAKYNAPRFLQMVSEHGGLVAAKKLINSLEISIGYTALYERKRLDLTVEAMILNEEKYHVLFSPDELEICRKRLANYGYDTADN